MNNNDLEKTEKLFSAISEVLKGDVSCLSSSMVNEIELGFGLITKVLSNGNSINDVIDILAQYGNNEYKPYQNGIEMIMRANSAN